MFHSRDLDYLRSDVRANCETFLTLCKSEGLDVLVTETVRDEDYQRDLAAKGYASKTATVPTFHACGAGLAFDICKNVKGHEYDDADFFAKCAAIGKKIGFSWGGDWTSFVDRTHFQWDAGGKYTSSMLMKGAFPPNMPLYQTRPVEKRALVRGDTGEEVRKLQALLVSCGWEIDADGSFGPATQKAWGEYVSAWVSAVTR